MSNKINVQYAHFFVRSCSPGYCLSRQLFIHSLPRLSSLYLRVFEPLMQAFGVLVITGQYSHTPVFLGGGMVERLGV